MFSPLTSLRRFASAAQRLTAGYTPLFCTYKARKKKTSTGGKTDTLPLVLRRRWLPHPLRPCPVPPALLQTEHAVRA